ncbi:MAG: amino acid dehydrogenase, partial [Acinetobacter sp.]
GAKSGINFDPADPRKKEVLERWYKAVMPLLKSYYGTGGDLNIDEIHEVIPITESYGLWHPQEGVISGHYQARENERIHQIGQLRYGVSKVLEDLDYTPDIKRKYKVADMITGYGVSESIRHYYNIWGGEIAGKKAIIQGWGNVAAAAGYYLTQQGVKVVGIIDRVGGLIKPEGFSEQEIKTLFNNRVSNTLVADNLIPFAEASEQIWNVGAEIFVPAASSRLVQQAEVDKMIAAGLEVIACGANVPFADKEIFFGSIMEHTDNHVAVIPDFIANCGMARVFAYLMQRNVEMSDDAIFSDASNIIHNALQAVYSTSNKRTNLSSTAFEIALKQLV